MAKELLPLVLSVKAVNWRMYDDDSAIADEEFKQVRSSVLTRDDHSCRFCGFRAMKWQEVHHVNDDHADNRRENLVTACIFCHMVQHIGLAGRNKEAVLAWIPEIDQARLHHIVRTLLVVSIYADGIAKDRNKQPAAIRVAKTMAEAARSLETKLRSREAKAAEIFGTSDPLELANVLQQIAGNPATAALYADRSKKLFPGLRLLPLGRRVHSGGDKMPEIVGTWLASPGPYSSLSPQTWHSLLRENVMDRDTDA